MVILLLVLVPISLVFLGEPYPLRVLDLRGEVQIGIGSFLAALILMIAWRGYGVTLTPRAVIVHGVRRGTWCSV